MSFDPFEPIDREVAALARDRLLRLPGVPGDLHVVCSNDYLGLGARPVTVTAPGGATASPLVSGYTDVHATAAECLAAWLRAESVTLFTSGYAANVGVLQALGCERTVLLSDALNHASIIDGCRLARARVEVVPHLDLSALEGALRSVRSTSAAARVWFVTESYFSMDGDVPDLREIRALCDRYDAGLVVDEAHALGVYGAEGRGLCASVGVIPDVLVGTLGKSFGLHGAFAAGRETLRTLLWNRARSLVFSTAPSPLVMSLVPGRVREVREGDELRAQVAERANQLRSALMTLATRRSAGGSASAIGQGPICPLVVGSVDRALSLAQELEAAGFLVKAMRPPTVPVHASRLRFTATLATPSEVAVRLCAFLAALP
ncbi:MAG: 8-amino-7-oxononanoate synthase [Polyangiaceae bacterium]